MYTYCANDPVNYTDPSGHDAIWLNSKKGAAGLGHAALLIEYAKKWRYFSWEQGGYKSPRMCRWIRNAVSKSKKKVYKRINKKRKDKASRPATKPYTTSIYIKGNFSNSYHYMCKIKNGKSKYKDYGLGTTNCAWMAIQVLKKGAIGKQKRKALWNLQYIKKRVGGGRQYKIGKRVIQPNNVNPKIAKIFGSRVKLI
ncbi:hypothetical protein NIA71_11520 [Ihubacter massiliensis]|nr:hypothetical protein [Ihubacter massiliensis]